MTAPALSRLTSVLGVAAVGLALGHVLRPLPAAGPARLAAFLAAMAGVGAWRGWREAGVRAEWWGRAPRRLPAAALGAALALAAAVVGYVGAHGVPTRTSF